MRNNKLAFHFKEFVLCYNELVTHITSLIFVVLTS